MGYHLGVDLGTTFTAAAVMNGGGPTMLGLGNRALQIPSVLYFHPDGSVLVGEAAELRSTSDPTRTVREFKRRIGDPVPILAAGRPYSAQAMTSRVLRWVLDKATEQMGEPPQDITLTYPANWANFKIDLLRQVATLADVTLARACSEPEAAALQYASRTKVAIGDRIAVYDLGGGTFDVCVLEKTDGGFRVLGRPEGIEHLGGIDFDEAVFRRVIDQLPPDAFESESAGGTEEEEAAQMAALGRLRRDCVEAKEALSTDVEAVIPVVLPRSRTSVRLTRGEFEDIIRPSIEETIGATRRALRSADTEPGRLAAMVLVGGSSRIPLVAELLANEFRCPIAIDTHPKNDVAMGAARAATLPSATSPLVTPTASATRSPATMPGTGRHGAPLPPVVPAGRPYQPQQSPPRPSSTTPYGAPPAAQPDGGRVPVGPNSITNPESSVAPTAGSQGPPGGWQHQPPGGSGTGQAGGPPWSGPPDPSSAREGADAVPAAAAVRRGRMRIALIAGAVAVLLAGTAAVVLIQRSGNDDQGAGGTTTSQSATPSSSAASRSSAASSAASSSAVSTATATVSAIGLPSSEALPDNQLVVSRTVDGATDLYLVDTATGAVGSKLTAGPAQHRMASLSPDRTSVIYLEETDTTRVPVVMAANGAGARLLFANPPPGCVRMNRPAWNPVTPNEIALVCVDGAGKTSLQIVGVNGWVIRTLTTGLARVDDLSYSPDGTKLTFWGSDPSTFDGGSIYVMAADGSSAPTAVTTSAVGTDADPVFSPDGTQIAFRRRLPGATARGNFDIFAINADGQNLRQLTDDAANDQDPSWSPDGASIAFVSERADGGGSGPSRLWVMDSAGNDERRLLTDDDATEVSAPAWARR